MTEQPLLMSAREAKAIADKYIEDLPLMQFNQVVRRIKEKADKGLFVLSTTDNLHPSVIETLKNLGYKHSSETDSCNMPYQTFTWHD